MGRWKLCSQPSEYDHSPALFYVMGEQGKFAVKDYPEFLAVLLKLEEMERASNADASSQAKPRKPEG